MPPAGTTRDGRDAVRARDRDRVALGVIRDPRAQLRVVVEHLVDVLEAARARLVEPDLRARVDEARIDVGPRASMVFAPGRHLHVGADASILLPRIDDRAALDVGPRDRVNRRVGDRPDRRRSPGSPRLRRSRRSADAGLAERARVRPTLVAARWLVRCGAPRRCFGRGEIRLLLLAARVRRSSSAMRS